jgi:tetratricopeptide (TPR) repeat protein
MKRRLRPARRVRAASVLKWPLGGLRVNERTEAARALHRDGRFLDAIAALGDPGADPDDWALRGDCCAELGLRKEALACWRRARTIDPQRRDLALRLAAELPGDGGLSPAEQAALLPGSSLPGSMNLAARRFLDLAAAPHLSTVYANDNLIVFQRALTFLHDPVFMGAVGRASEGEPTFAAAPGGRMSWSGRRNAR